MNLRTKFVLGFDYLPFRNNTKLSHCSKVYSIPICSPSEFTPHRSFIAGDVRNSVFGEAHNVM